MNSVRSPILPLLAVVLAFLLWWPRERSHASEEASARNLIAEVIELVQENYILEERIPAIVEAMQKGLDTGAYDGLAPGSLALRLSEDLRRASSDLHFGLRAVPAQGDGPPKPLPPPNHGLRTPRVLAGNVGYLQLTAFVDPALAAPTADAAFVTLADTDALVVDLRKSGGGHPGMVTYLASYFFSGEPFLLNRIEWRNPARTLELWTHAELPAPRYTGREVFLLTSHSTPSAAEGFTYHLKHFERARVVGETTAGAAHPVRTFEIGGTLQIAVPSGRAINPRTNDNWEGVGVQPDFAVPASEALDTAHRLALEELLAKAPEGEGALRLRRALASLAAQP